MWKDWRGPGAASLVVDVAWVMALLLLAHILSGTCGRRWPGSRHGKTWRKARSA